jgi:hypothetical protein
VRVRILCKPPNHPTDGFGELEEYEEEIVGGKFRREGATFYRKFRRLLLKNIDFPLVREETYYILIVDDPHYFSYLPYKIISYNTGHHPDDFEWILDFVKEDT